MAARIGLTGGIGCGKSTVCSLFKQLGVFSISADEVAHQLMVPGTEQYTSIVQKFGDAVVDDNDDINRTALGSLVFSDTEKKSVLEAILHPPIRQRMQAAADRCEDPYCILEIPLLIETGQHLAMDRIAVITCDTQTRIKRLMHNRTMTEASIEAVLKNQLSDQQRVAHAHDVIDNSGDLEQLEKQITQLHDSWTERFKPS